MAETSNSEALEPDMLAEAKRQSDWLLWETAIGEELDMLEAAGTWRLEEAPPGANIIGSKWVFYYGRTFRIVLRVYSSRVALVY